MTIRKLSLSALSAALLISAIAPLKAEDKEFKFGWHKRAPIGVALTAVAAIFLAGVAHLHFKTRTPQAELPKEGSILSYLWYLWNEKFVGVMKTEERIKQTKPDPEHPEVTKYEYEKIYGRGLLGIGAEYSKGMLTAAALLLIAKDFWQWKNGKSGPTDTFGGILTEVGFGEYVPVVTQPTK